MSTHDNLEKNESPTKFKIKKAREMGEIPRSKELTSWLILVFGFISLFFFGQKIVVQISKIIKSNFTFNFHTINSEKYFYYIYVNVRSNIILIILFIINMMIITYISSILVGGVNVKTKNIIKIKNINLINGLKHLLSFQIFIEFMKICMKISIIFIVSTLFIFLNFTKIQQLLYNEFSSNIFLAKKIIFNYIFIILMSISPLVVLDVIFQIKNYIKKLRMSRYEIQEENKEHEGNPYIKSFIKQRQKEQKQILNLNVKKANVVITNPTHYAVAIFYESKEMTAPIVVAKGKGIIAINIKRKAQTQGIPLLISPLLAKVLYKYCNIGKSIPISFYSIIAEILAWVYNLNKWNKIGGIKPNCPKFKIPKHLL